MNIAKIFVGDPNNKKGAFNNVIERCKRLLEVGGNVQCYMIRFYYPTHLRVLKKWNKAKTFERTTIVEGVQFKNIWLKLSLIDYLMCVKLRRSLPMCRKQLRRNIGTFKNFDLLSVHGYEACYLASLCKEEYGIPFVSTWHGSDINYMPFFNDYMKKRARYFLEASAHNFFVSRQLMSTARLISSRFVGSTLYTGPSVDFEKNVDRGVVSEKGALNNDTCAQKIVAYIGSLVEVKNVLILPDIFVEVCRLFPNVSFLVVGDGKLKDELKSGFERLGINNVSMIGDVSPKDVVKFMMNIDVLVLPSFNEGLPRVALEALSLSVPVVGSDRGGIPEAIGEANSFCLEDDFVQRSAKRIVHFLETEDRPSGLPGKFSWDRALEFEAGVHQRVLSASTMKSLPEGSE